MRIVHLTASTFFGGPERQMLGLGRHLPSRFHSTYVSYPEGGRSTEFLEQVRSAGFDAISLQFDTPNVRGSLDELTRLLKTRTADLLVCHTFKPNVLGRLAARRVGIPVIVVSRGWTWENLKVRVYETMDRVNLRFVDHVVAVSNGQAERVRKCGVPSHRLNVIHNAARLAAFAAPDPEYRRRLRNLFPVDTVVSHFVLAAGRLSPEKGFGVLIEAAAEVLKRHPTAGFVLFGEGTERQKLEARVRELGMGEQFRVPGHTTELDQFLPWADAAVLPSFTEGLPNVALEASAAGVPVVATAVGGTPEVVADQETGFLVPSGQPEAMAERMNQLLADEPLRKRLGGAGRVRMHERFSFEAQAEQYAELFERVANPTIRKAA
jgi:glycosyltransferase involved in cell wall biosynthesis